MKRTLLAFLSTALVFASAFAHADIKFTTSSFDFGTFNDSKGDVTTEFEFTNTGDAPLLIIRAVSSCGCTDPEYPKEPIRPGQKGKIKVTYHAKGRPGPFTKSIAVYDNSKPNHRSQLTITGNVLDKRTPEESYAHEMGAGMRIKTRALNFFDVYPTKANRTRTLQVYNDSDEPIQITSRNVPKHIVLTNEPEVIQPKKEGKVLVTYLTDKVKDWGMRKDDFYLYVKGKETKMKDNKIIVTADIWEDFSDYSRSERENAPVIDVSTRELEFGTCKEPKTMTIQVTNEGHAKMIVRKISNDMPEVFKAKISNETIKSGASATLTVTFVPSACKMSAISHHITIITNDPANSRVIINLNADK